MMGSFLEIRGSDAYQQHDGEWMTLDIKRIPVGMFNDILLSVINDYSGEYEYKEKFEISRNHTDGTIRLSMLFRVK